MVELTKIIITFDVCIYGYYLMKAIERRLIKIKFANIIAHKKIEFKLK